MLAKCTRLGFPKLRPLAISEPSEAQTFPPETGSSREDSRAKIFPSLVKALGFRVSDPASGTNTPELLASYDPDTRSWKTSALSLFGDSIPYSGALPRSGTMRNGRIYAPPMSERPTEGNGSGLWPTSTLYDGIHPGSIATSGGQVHLVQAVHSMFPTPRLSDAERGGRGDLIQAVRGNPNKHYRLWPTPTSNRWDGLQSHGINVITGQLNPTWVEWLMGYPSGWTDLNASGIVLSLRSPK